MSEEMEAPEVAAEAPTPAPEEIALEASTPIEAPPTPAATPIKVAPSIEEAAQADAHPAYQWMSARELVKLFRVERSTLRLWTKAGKLESRTCDPTKALGPRALEYRIPPGKPVPAPGPQSNAARRNPIPKPAPQIWADDGTHMAYQWTQGSRAMALLLGIESSTVPYWVERGLLERRVCATDPRSCEYRVPPDQPIPAPTHTGGRARRALREEAAQAPDAPAVSSSRIKEETRQHMLLTEARIRCAELDAQIEDLTAQLAAQTQREREQLLDAGDQGVQLAAQIEALETRVEALTAQLAEREAQLAARIEEIEQVRGQELTARWRVQQLEALVSGAAQTPVSLRSVLDEVARWMGASVIGLDIRLETGARIGVTP